MMYRVCLLFSFSWLIICADHNHDWNYEELGPDVWSEKYPTCGGQFQSPINILTACTVYKNFTPFELGSGYNENHNFTLKNNGHTILGTFNNEPELSAFRLTGGDLKGNFEFVNFHLHWGANHKSGSEHEVNGMQHPGEIHFVYKNPLTNQTAVLAIFMKSVSETNTFRLDKNKIQLEWQRFFDIAETLKEEDDSVILGLNLDLLIGETLTDFWRYEGSLTTPPCTEGIIWTIFKKEIVFVESEFVSFRSNVYFEDYRRPQPLYNRIIYRNFINETSSSIPDYNCCPRKDANRTTDQLTSSFELIYCSTYLLILSFILMIKLM